MTRCPYCHDAFDDYGRVCAVCLARHHDDCWVEAGRCASCSGELALALRREDPLPARRVWRAIAFMSVTPMGLIGCCSAWLWLYNAEAAWRYGPDLAQALGLLVTLPLALSALLLPVALLWLCVLGPLAGRAREARAAAPLAPAPRARLDLDPALAGIRAERSHVEPLIQAKRRALT